VLGLEEVGRISNEGLRVARDQPRLEEGIGAIESAEGIKI
jgi:hypothetical protein